MTLADIGEKPQMSEECVWYWGGDNKHYSPHGDMPVKDVGAFKFCPVCGKPFRTEDIRHLGSFLADYPWTRQANRARDKVTGEVVTTDICVNIGDDLLASIPARGGFDMSTQERSIVARMMSEAHWMYAELCALSGLQLVSTHALPEERRRAHLLDILRGAGDDTTRVECGPSAESC